MRRRKRRIVERVIRKKGRIIRVREKRRQEGGRVSIVEFGEEREAREVMESRGEIRYCWG